MTFPEPRQVRAELVAQATLSPRVRGLTLATLGPEPLDWVPGQYVEVAPAGDERRTPFSIASMPDPARPGQFELAVLRGGALDDVVVGGAVDVFGPKGSFVRRDPEGCPEVFVATGTGLAPIRAIVQQALASGGTSPLLLLSGARTELELLWRAELEALCQAHSRLRYEPIVSQPQNGWAGRTGRVQAHLAELVVPLAGAHVYVCGVGEMVVECVAKLVGELGVPAERVFTEKH